MPGGPPPSQHCTMESYLDVSSAVSGGRRHLNGDRLVIGRSPLSDVVLGNIVRLQLDRIAKRVVEQHKIPFEYDDEAVKLIVSRCTEVESGGRMIDAILTNTVLPRVSLEYLSRLATGQALGRVRLSVVKGDFDYAFS